MKLLEEAKTNGYNECEVYEELLATVHEAELCTKTALQISSGKCKGIVMSITTRGSSSIEKRMDVSELEEFLIEVESLPCKLPEADILLVGD